MLHTKHLRQAFIAQKGFLTPSKDAMEDKIKEVVAEKVVEKAIEQLEEKKEEIEKKVDEVADKVEDSIEKASEEVGKQLEEAAKPIADIIDKLDDNPQIANAIEMVSDIIVDQLTGREVSCSCFGWLFALRITRKTPPTPPSKPEETLPKIEIASPSQDSKAAEQSPPTAPQPAS